jgi:hypothetical protein
MRFSDDYDVNEAVKGLLCSMDPDGWMAIFISSAPKVKQSTMTLADVIERIRFQFGDRAAASIRITVH